MKPTWIFNFVKKDSIESFFTTFWNSVQSNSSGNCPRLYYITDGFSDDFSVERVVTETAKNIVTPMGNTSQLIEGWRDKDTVDHTRHTGLNLIFVGDITNKETQKSMHKLAAMLRSSLLDDDRRWTKADVRSYALLWRPQSVSVEPVSGACKDFLTELHNLMQADINHRPFHKVLFFESPETENGKTKDEMIEAMALATLHLTMHSACENDDILFAQPDKKYLNAGVAGIFYEKEIQKEQEAFWLSTMLMDKLKNGTDGEFKDAHKAHEVLEKNNALVESLSPEQIDSSIKAKCPAPYGNRDAYGVDCKVNPLSFRLKEVWNTYYNKYVVNLKKDLVNKTKQILFQFSEDYKDKLHSERISFVNSKVAKIEDFIFEMFKNPAEHDVISIPQSKLLLDKFSARIDDYFKTVDTGKFTSFALPAYLNGAYEQAANEHNADENSVLAVLDGKLRNHSVFILSVLVRAIILGMMLVYFVTLLFDNEIIKYIVGSLTFLLPIFWGLWRFHEHVSRIDALKDQYTACVLMRLQKELNEELKEGIKHVYTDVLDYCKWLKEHKLDYLEKKLSIIKPLEFSFTESKYFIPLLNCNVSNNDNSPISAENLNNNITRDILTDRKQISGAFDEHELLREVPIGHVKINDETILTINDVLNDTNKGYKTRLLKELLQCRTQIRDNSEMSVRFKNEYKSNTLLLILDVSGSMRGQKLSDLKDVVSKLEQKASSMVWIAFNDNVVADGNSSKEFGAIKAGGCTNYIPALERATEILKSSPADKVIFISDGGPAETLKNILETAYKLNQPVHTISIGNDGRDVMRQLAEKTNGVQIVVDDIKDISAEVEDKLNVEAIIGKDGEYTFGESMQKCYIPGCVKMLFKYAIERTQTERFSIHELLGNYSNEKGMQEWLNFSMPTCQYAVALSHEPERPIIFLQLVTPVNPELRNNVLNDKLNITSTTNMPDIVASIISLQPMNALSDLQGFRL